jgi:ferrous iron transport protein A
VPVVVSAVELDRDLVAWLSAVGIREGEKVTVLRRAAFGGPLHVRTGAGGEFALGRPLARAIRVSPIALDEAAE